MPAVPHGDASQAVLLCTHSTLSTVHHWEASLAHTALPAVSHGEAGQALVCCTHIVHLLGLHATIVCLLRLPRHVHSGAATPRA